MMNNDFGRWCSVATERGSLHFDDYDFLVAATQRFDMEGVREYTNVSIYVYMCRPELWFGRGGLNFDYRLPGTVAGIILSPDGRMIHISIRF